MTTTKRIKICCSNTINKERSSYGSTVWRSWRILIRPCEKDDLLRSYIDHVDYFLHESFKTPHVVCYEEPYIVQQEGWGEFDLKIVFHFRDQSIPPETVIFELKFLKPNYSEYRTLYLTDNESLSLSQQSPDIDNNEQNNSKKNKRKKRRLLPASAFTTATTSEVSDKWDSRVDNETSSKRERQRAPSSASESCSSIVNTPTDNTQLLLYFEDLRHQQQQQQKRRSLSDKQMQHQESLINQPAVSHKSNRPKSPFIDPSYSFSDSNTAVSLENNRPTSPFIDPNQNYLCNSAITEEKQIDMSLLATNLESLNDDNLREVYDIFLQYDRKDMLLLETEDHVLFDLNSLDTSLLSKLWEFTQNVVTHQQHQEQQQEQQQEQEVQHHQQLQQEWEEPVMK